MIVLYAGWSCMGEDGSWTANAFYILRCGASFLSFPRDSDELSDRDMAIHVDWKIVGRLKVTLSERKLEITNRKSIRIWGTLGKLSEFTHCLWAPTWSEVCKVNNPWIARFIPTANQISVEIFNSVQNVLPQLERFVYEIYPRIDSDTSQSYAEFFYQTPFVRLFRFHSLPDVNTPCASSADDTILPLFSMHTANMYSIHVWEY